MGTQALVSKGATQCIAVGPFSGERTTHSLLLVAAVGHVTRGLTRPNERCEGRFVCQRDGDPWEAQNGLRGRRLGAPRAGHDERDKRRGQVRIARDNGTYLPSLAWVTTSVCGLCTVPQTTTF